MVDEISVDEKKPPSEELEGKPPAPAEDSELVGIDEVALFWLLPWLPWLPWLP